MGKRFSGWMMAGVLAAGTAVALEAAGQQPQAVTISVARDGVPAANVTVEFQFLNAGKVPAGTTGSTGDLALAMSLVNGGKATRLQVVVYDCPNDRSMVVLVEAGATAPENVDCKRRILGWFWFGRSRAVLIDTVRGTVQTTGGQSFLGSTRGRLIAGGGAALGGIALLSAGGGDSNSGGTGSTGSSGTPGGSTFDPNGNYGVTNSVATDPGGHRFFVIMEDNTVLTVVITGSSIRITCPPGSKWTQINGTFNPSTGQITAGEGRGTAAGFSNVLYRFTGTITMSGSTQGTLNGQLTVGAAGEFPGGQPIVYNVSGRRQ